MKHPVWSKEFWLGYYEDESYEGIDKPFVRSFYKGGVFSNLFILLLALVGFAVIVGVFVFAGFTLETLIQ